MTGLDEAAIVVFGQLDQGVDCQGGTFTGLDHHIGGNTAICSRRVRSVFRQHWRVFRPTGRALIVTTPVIGVCLLPTVTLAGPRSEQRSLYQVLKEIEPFVSARVSAFSTDEKNASVFHFSLLIESLNGLSPDIRAITGSDLVKASILRAKNRILAATAPA